MPSRHRTAWGKKLSQSLSVFAAIERSLFLSGAEREQSIASVAGVSQDSGGLVLAPLGIDVH